MGFMWFVCNATAMYVNITHYTDLWFEDHTHSRTYSINELGKWLQNDNSALQTAIIELSQLGNGHCISLLFEHDAIFLTSHLDW